MTRVFHEEARVRAVLLEYLSKPLAVSQQLSMCNQLHEEEARLARWFLMVNDRAEGKETLITQGRLGDLLGLQRTTIALAAGALQRQGCIDYARGKVRMIERERLTRKACRCYAVTRETLALTKDRRS